MRTQPLLSLQRLRLGRGRRTLAARRHCKQKHCGQKGLAHESSVRQRILLPVSPYVSDEEKHTLAGTRASRIIERDPGGSISGAAHRETAALRTMILIDPQLDLSRAADVLNPGSAKPAAGSVAALKQKPPAKSLRLPSTRTLARFLAEAQAAVRLRGNVTVLLTNDAAMRDLNSRFRRKNKPTDVLSFPAANLVQDQKNQEKGDLAIGVETALRQAAEQGHSLAVEIKVLILHGVLHLAGHDHESDKGEMQRRERSLRASLGLPQGLIERSQAKRESRPKPRPTAGGASRRDARKIAPDGVRRGTRRTQSGESMPQSAKPRRGARNAPAHAARSVRP